MLIKRPKGASERILLMALEHLIDPINIQLVTYIYSEGRICDSEAKKYLSSIGVLDENLFGVINELGYTPMVARKLLKSGDSLYEITEFGNDFVEANLSIFEVQDEKYGPKRIS